MPRFCSFSPHSRIISAHAECLKMLSIRTLYFLCVAMFGVGEHYCCGCPFALRPCFNAVVYFQCCVAILAFFGFRVHSISCEPLTRCELLLGGAPVCHRTKKAPPSGFNHWIVGTILQQESGLLQTHTHTHTCTHTRSLSLTLSLLSLSLSLSLSLCLPHTHTYQY